MMISSVSNVRFCANDDMFSRPGAYTRPIVNTPEQKPGSESQKSKTGKILMGTAITAAVLLGTAVALRHFAPDTFKILENTEGAKFIDKTKHYIAKTGQFIIDKSVQFGSWVKNLVKRNPAPANPTNAA